MTDAAIEERNEQVAEAITSGRSLRLVRKEFSLTETELDAILERLWPLSTEARIRRIKHDVACLQRLIEKFFEKALAGDVNSGVLCVRAWERKAALLGLDAVQRIDLQVINPPQQATRYERITEAVERLTGRRIGQPNGGDGQRLNGGSPPLDHDQDDDPDEPDPLIGG